MSATGEKIEAICDVDLDSLEMIAPHSATAATESPSVTPRSLALVAGVPPLSSGRYAGGDVQDLSTPRGPQRPPLWGF